MKLCEDESKTICFWHIFDILCCWGPKIKHIWIRWGCQECALLGPPRSGLVRSCRRSTELKSSTFSKSNPTNADAQQPVPSDSPSGLKPIPLYWLAEKNSVHLPRNQPFFAFELVFVLGRVRGEGLQVERFSSRQPPTLRQESLPCLGLYGKATTSSPHFFRNFGTEQYRTLSGVATTLREHWRGASPIRSTFRHMFKPLVRLPALKPPSCPWT